MIEGVEDRLQVLIDAVSEFDERLQKGRLGPLRPGPVTADPP